MHDMHDNPHARRRPSTPGCGWDDCGWQLEPTVRSVRLHDTGGETLPIVCVSQHLTHSSCTARVIEGEYLTRFLDKAYVADSGSRVKLSAIFGGDHNSYTAPIPGRPPLPAVEFIGRPGPPDPPLPTRSASPTSTRCSPRTPPAASIVWMSGTLLLTLLDVDVIDMTGLSAHHGVRARLHRSTLAGIGERGDVGPGLVSMSTTAGSAEAAVLVGRPCSGESSTG